MKQKILDIRVTTFTRIGYTQHSRYNNNQYKIEALEVTDNSTAEEARKNGLDLESGYITIKESGLYVFYHPGNLYMTTGATVHYNKMTRLKVGDKLEFKTREVTPFDFVIYKLA